jgi:AcrR family transcriptional regulator
LVAAQAKAFHPAWSGRREQAKEERRARIVAAARELVSAVGVEEMSMKQVATTAEVSLSTVYNLFDSKEAVLRRVFTEAFERYLALTRTGGPEDSLERIFHAVDVAADLYASDAEFYRSAAWLVGRGSSLKQSLQEPRVRFWCDLIAGMVADGRLTPAAEPTTIGACCMTPLFATAYQAWSIGATPIDEFRARVKFGFAALLKAFARPQDQARLDLVIEQSQALLRRSTCRAAA